ncbi:hypothetical protein D1871_02395 [Nakamurella silvestris]|nr:hypothetical protein D1871_02395 [Nakamurella silvestris]
MHSFLTPEPITCEIRNSAGEVVIELSDTSTTTVDLAVSDGHPLGFIGNNPVVNDMLRAVDRWRGNTEPPEGTSVETDQIELVNVHFEDSRLIVDTDPARNGLFSAFTVRIGLPSGSSVRTKTHSADIGVSGRADRLELRTASGDITVNRADGAVVAQTSSGDVEIASVGADLDLRAVSGSVEIGSVTGKIHVQTTSGDLVILDPESDVKVRSVSGDVDVRAVRAGTTEITTVSGDVLIGVAPGVAAEINLQTIAGQAKSDFQVEQPDSERGLVAGGTPLVIRANTTTGDINLRSAVAAG